MGELKFSEECVLDSFFTHLVVFSSLRFVFNFLVKEVLTACTYAKTWPAVRSLCAGWTDSQAGRTTYLKIPASARLQTWACHALTDCFSKTTLIIIEWSWISLREGKPSPNSLSSEFAALNSARCGGKAYCWQQGWRMVTGSRGWQPSQADLAESGQGWKTQQGRQSGKLTEKTVKAGLQRSLFC